MPWASAISRMRTGGSLGRCRANTSMAKHAYSAFAEIFMGENLSLGRGLGGGLLGQIHPHGVGLVRGPPLGGKLELELAAIERVQPALRLGLASPASSAFVGFTGDDRLGAGPASDRRVSLVVQR